MSVETRPMNTQTEDATKQAALPAAVIAKWVRRCGIPLSILAWTAVVALVLWGASHIARSLLILAIAALLAFAIAPLVKLLQRVMPRFLAVLIVYLFVLTGISLLVYLVVSTAIEQGVALAAHARTLFGPGGQGQLKVLEQPLIALGIPAGQLAALPQQIFSRVGGAANSAVPLLLSFFDFLLDIVIIAVMSIYLLLDGGRVTQWLRTGMPLMERSRINFLLDTLQRIVGGYIRGQLVLSTLIGLLVGIGMTLFHVPYAVLLGVLAFILEFIPVLGTLVSGAICVLLALTQGWLIAVFVLAYFIVMHILEGDVVGPRIVGKAVGLHPVVSLAALVAGAELFGIWGALFASPVAGVLQAVLIALWSEWRSRSPEQFPGQKQVAHELEQHVAAEPVNPTQ
ncbi:MAG TPA: AI-2E family transporter [Ktedonobacteraceae bacterium]|nr:AI-2E family transporter [Ktedonobacteraceae bacterium]